MTYLKKLIGTKSLNTEQCPAGLSPRIIPHYLPPKHLWETLGMGKNLTQQPKIYWFPPPEKFPLINLLLSLSKMSFLPHQIVIFIYYIIQASYVAVAIAIVSFLHQLQVLINWYLLNVVFSMTKALNDQSSPKQNFSPPFNATWKTLLLFMRVFLFFALPFLFQTL